MKKACGRENCRFIHDPKLCDRFFNFGTCKFHVHCRKHHYVTDNRMGQTQNRVQIEKKGNIIENGTQNGVQNKERRGDDLYLYDMRLVLDTGSDKLSKKITERDVVLVPNLFKDFAPNDLRDQVLYEVENCGISKKDLFKLWHSDSHHLVDDKLPWKEKVPTFGKIIDIMKEFFNVRVEATRLNYYENSKSFKYYHTDAAAFRPDKAKKQNFTICLHLGAPRTVAFRNIKTRTITSIPLEDGQIYCFSKQVNVEFEHAVLKEQKPSDECRLSIVIWGWLNNMEK